MKKQKECVSEKQKSLKGGTNVKIKYNCTKQGGDSKKKSIEARVK